MGTYQHNAMLITFHNSRPEEINTVCNYIIQNFKQEEFSTLLGLGYNGYKSICIFPCGSKLESEINSAFRQRLRDLQKFILEQNRYIPWAEMSYGPDGYYTFDNTDCDGVEVEDKRCENCKWKDTPLSPSCVHGCTRSIIFRKDNWERKE